MRKVLGILVLASAVMVSACNTISGVGRDLESAGETVANTADGNK